MFKNNSLTVLLASVFFFSFGAIHAEDNAGAQAGQALHIDIPVRVVNPKVAFNIDRLAFVEDKPVVIGHLNLLLNDLSELKTKGRIIAIFHTDAGYAILNDRAYNADRQVTTGNPFKEALASLMKRGVQIELDGATAKAHGWGNADLLPGVKVNKDAMIRLTQLGEEGFVEIKE